MGGGGFLPGTWVLEQVGVKAPGSAKTTTLLPVKEHQDEFIDLKKE